jgi:DNA-binding response OmpR family regulator
MMPQRNGFEVCRKIRENPALRDVKIVMLTAKGRDVEKDRGLNLGANAYVTKPFSTKELMNTVRGLLPASE